MARRLGRTTATLMTAAMIIGTGIFGALGPATASAGSGIILAMLLGGLVALLTGISAAQLGVNFPRHGGAFTWAREFKHQTVGFIAGCAYLGKAVFSLGVISLAFAEYSAQLVPGLPTPILAISVLLAILLLNLLRVELTTRVLIGLMLVNVSLLAVFVGLTLPSSKLANFSYPLGNTGIVGLLAGTALFFWTWDGFMRTAIMAGEIKEPKRTIPVAIIGGIAIAAVVFIAVAAAALGVLGPESMGKDNVPLFRAAVQAVGLWGGVLVLLTAWIASLTELVGDMLGASRVVFAMGEARELPHWLGTVNARARVPRNAVLVLGLVVVGLVAFFDLRSLLSVASFFTLVWYTITHFSALQLRGNQRLTAPILTWLGLIGCIILFVSLPFWAIATGLFSLVSFTGIRMLLRRDLP